MTIAYCSVIFFPCCGRCLGCSFPAPVWLISFHTDDSGIYIYLYCNVATFSQSGKKSRKSKLANFTWYFLLPTVLRTYILCVSTGRFCFQRMYGYMQCFLCTHGRYFWVFEIRRIGCLFGENQIKNFSFIDGCLLKECTVGTFFLQFCLFSWIIFALLNSDPAD